MRKLERKYRHIFLILIFIVMSLILINFVYVSIVKNNQTDINALQYKLKILSQRINDKDTLSLRQVNFKYSFEKNLNKVVCDSLLKGKSKVIMLFGQKSCSQCIVKNIMDLNIISEITGKDRIVLAGDFTDKKSLSTYLENIPHKDFSYMLFQNLIETSDLHVEVPIIILLDVDYSIKILFYDHDENIFLKKMFFEKLKDYMS